VANGLCLLFAFTHRVAVSLYLTYWLYTVSHEIMSVSPGLYNFLFYGSVVLALMNINWYSTLVMRVVQHFLPSRPKDDIKEHKGPLNNANRPRTRSYTR
jgi:hypothetical protein